MTDATMTNSTATAGRRALRWLVAGVLLAITATVTLTAWAQHMPGGRGMDGAGMFMGSPERMGHMIDHMLDGLNATDAQRTQIKQIAQAAAADLKAQHEAGRALRDKAMQVFTAPTVDAAAAESLRQQMLTQHDQVSRRMLQAMLDVSRVLTPEQRAKIGERMKQRSEMMHERMQRMQREHPKQ